MKTLYSIGLMTGTSCDAADFALLRLRYDGKKTSETIVSTFSVPIPEYLRNQLLHAQKGMITMREYGRLNQRYSLWIAGACKKAMGNFGISSSRLIFSIHGQTLWHEPPNAREKKGFSIQMLDPSIVSIATGCTVVSNFRQADLARGGEGAPLVPTYLRQKTLEEGLLTNRFISIHNIGGISNFGLFSKSTKKCLAFDTGPGNCLIDLSIQLHTNSRKKYDQGGRIAMSAAQQIDWIKIRKLATHKYFKKKPPKSTGRELFNESFLKKFKSSGARLVAETTALSAYTMAKSYSDFSKNISDIYFYGGGSKNTFLISLFEKILKQEFKLSPEIKTLPETFAGVEFLEAAAFARFGFNALMNSAVALSDVTGACQDSTEAAIFPGKNFDKIFKVL